MICVPFEVEHVLLKFMFSFLTFTFLFFEVRTFIFLFIVFVTLIVTSWCRSMRWPFAKTNPTKIMFTCSTRHMITSLVFLYRSFAFRTTFRVCHNPCHILWLCIIFFIPFRCNITITRLVRLLTTWKAESIATCTVYKINCAINSSFKTNLTPLLWAPFYWLIIICIWFT